MFRRLREAGGTPVRFTLDGRAALARAGDSVAAALLAEGALAQRLSPVSGEPRGPYCLIGACFECLVTIDGVGNRQGCLIPVAEGMAVETGRGRRALASEAGACPPAPDAVGRPAGAGGAPAVRTDRAREAGR